MSSSGNIVKLDIGGVVFKTSRSTLTRFDGFFKTILETDVPVTKDETGAIFIDRDPKHFRLILNYMRDGDVALPTSEQEFQEIQKEAQYYLLTGLVGLCNVEVPMKIHEVPRKLNIIESDNDVIQIISNPEKPVVIIGYSIEYWAQTFHLISAIEFVEKYKDHFDVYFKKNCNDRLDWNYSIHDKKPSEHAKTIYFWDAPRFIQKLEDVMADFLKKMYYVGVKVYSGFLNREPDSE